MKSLNKKKRPPADAGDRFGFKSFEVQPRLLAISISQHIRSLVPQRNHSLAHSKNLHNRSLLRRSTS